MNESWHPAVVAGTAIRLYRPVGPVELQLIRDGGFKSFPPRLPEQPFFYPVLNEKYAKQIALEWNKPRDGEAFVVVFSVRTEFLLRYEEKVVGSSIHREFWIPAEDLEEMNRNIAGQIEILVEYH